MIKKINHTDIQDAVEILRVQLPAYKREAELIGFQGIPQLKDQTEDIQSSSEVFTGYYEGDMLCGFISFEILGETMDICRLVVDPEHFRKGIAGRLIQYLLEENPHLKKMTVSTGTANLPAVNLYEKYGFKRAGTTEITNGITLTQLVKQI
ncbi:GNAT family N-acetyltransferase [Peribacillus deserti]|uniref:GNAT family N-acetyltransferase n=1 Tax=Peribacillus deserti TaxID=673318 RepID=A0A2N5M6D9_9BACI|nr:GNAT family N-acetyltransferase [Peribacillus deserti]PLT29919.1 GNAT family N-acetyltransferase [Peribacillus deserti]